MNASRSDYPKLAHLLQHLIRHLAQAPALRADDAPLARVVLERLQPEQAVGAPEAPGDVEAVADRPVLSMSLLLLRDRWLHRAVRDRLNIARCLGCSYSLRYGKARRDLPRNTRLHLSGRALTVSRAAGPS